jgi:hypothetical protein
MRSYGVAHAPVVQLQSEGERQGAGGANWSLGDVLPLGHRALRVIEKRDDDADQPPVLIVEDAAG